MENKNTSQKKAEILVVIKPSFAKKYAKNNYSFVKRAIEKVEKETAKQRRKVVIKVRFKMQNRKNLRCRLDRATLHYLTDKKIRELQWDNGNMRLTLDLKALRTIRKQTAKEVSLTLKKIGSKKILSKIKKTNRKRFAYEFSIIDAKKKKISSIKKGKITIELGYQRSHTDKKSKMYVYQMNKKGSAVNILKSHNDVKRKKIRFLVNHPCRVVIGRKI
ncbi:igA Peptidase M64 [Clostridium sp. CAG:230]|nr:igA Peptidase M64 [Clostridium sp. CAG:230]